MTVLQIPHFFIIGFCFRKKLHALFYIDDGAVRINVCQVCHRIGIPFEHAHVVKSLPDDIRGHAHKLYGIGLRHDLQNPPVILAESVRPDGVDGISHSQMPVPLKLKDVLFIDIRLGEFLGEEFCQNGMEAVISAFFIVFCKAVGLIHPLDDGTDVSVLCNKLGLIQCKGAHL